MASSGDRRARGRSSGRERAAVRLIGIRDPGPGLGQFGDSVRCRFALDALEKPLIKGGKEFFSRCHFAMLAQDLSPVPRL